jgi:hypothetical protein
MGESTAGLLRELDHSLPDVRADAVMARAARHVVRRRRALTAGIGGALLVAGAAAAAIPGTPLHRYAQRVLGSARHQQPRAAAPAARSAPSGIAFVPEGAVEIVFRATQAGGVIRIALTDSDAVRVTGEGAGYVVTDRGVAVENMGAAGSYDVTLPRRTARATVRVGDVVVFARNGARVATAATRDDSGRYVIAFGDLRRRAP